MVFLIKALFPLLFLFFTSFSLAYANANTVFFDDFESMDEENWTIADNQNDVTIYDVNPGMGILKLSSATDNEYPFLELKHNLSSLGSFSIEVKYRMTSSGFGSGLIFTDKELFRSTTGELNWDDFILLTWPRNPSGFDIYSRPCSKDDLVCEHNDNKKSLAFTNDGQWHLLKFSYQEGYYSIYKDGVEIFESEKTERKIKYLYFGSPLITHTSTQWPSQELDYISITTGESQLQVQKFLLVPGLGTSWDMSALMSGEPGGNWQIPEFVDLYDSMVKSIENNGYAKNKDLFVFAYDWRKSVDDLADDLKSYIDSIDLNEGEKIKVVGHSMGGLVARAYAQKYEVDKIEGVYTLGSPHTGVLDAYPVWEAATVWGDVWWEKAALELAVYLNGELGDSRVKTLRTQAPGIKDLLPVYDYLNKDGKTIPWSQTIQKNIYMNSLNQSFQGIDPIFNTIIGLSGETRSVLKVTNRNALDRLLDRWEDGKPIDSQPYEFAIGDGTVIKTSASGPFTSVFELNKSHIGLAYEKESLEALFDKIGLDKTKVEIVEPDKRENFLTVILRSPGKLRICDKTEVTCDDQLGYYFPDYKLFLLPGYSGEALSISVIEQGIGGYDLHVGLIKDEADWEVVSGNLVSANQVDKYIVKGVVNEVSLSPDGDTEQRVRDVASARLNLYSNTWDRGEYFRKSGDGNLPANLRLKYIRLLRTILRQEFKKVSRSNNYEYLKAVYALWQANDRMSINILRGSSAMNAGKVNAYFTRVKKLSDIVITRMRKSNKQFAAVIYELGRDKLDESATLSSQDTDLKYDLIMSAEYLLYSSLDNI